MRLSSVRSRKSAAAVLAAALGPCAFSSSAAAAQPAASSVKWTKISTDTGLGIASAGMYRTGDGRLHVVWTRNDHAKGFSLHFSTLGSGAKLLNTGAIVGSWSSLTTYPRLVAGPNGGIRLVFTGANGKIGQPV